MNITRRNALRSLLLGGGMLGLKSLASGLPMKLLLDPKKALADTTAASCGGAMAAAQFVIFNTSGQGDPIGCNAPGTYDDPTSGIDLSSVAHPGDPSMQRVTMSIGGKSYGAAAPWATLDAGTLARTCFCHVMTNTPVHPKEPEVLQLMGTTLKAEMFPSVLAAQLAPCLGTLQAQPISVGASTPSEALTFQGQALPTIPPNALRATLANPAGELTSLQGLRDSSLNSLYDVYKNGATKAQRDYIDSLVTSQMQVRGIKQDQLQALSSITDNGVTAQITAAIALIQMGVSPVVAVHIPFGGDNHSDANLATETAQTAATNGSSGVSAIAALVSALAAAGYSDRVSFVSLNVFGRTMGAANTSGRQHNQFHQMSMMIGKPFRGSVVGALGAVDTTTGSFVAPGSPNSDFGALPIDSKTGVGSTGGDIAPVDTLASFGKTVLTAFGVPAVTVNTQIASGTVIQGALAGS